MENIKEEFLFPQRISLAMAYVPYQPFNNLYDPETSLKRGTIFKALDMPFMGGKGLRK
ncbi:MAG TPA: spore coat associated protein CotJA [Clostridiales bacterium]|nr:spore coat associated protein CotJA [Clostridiales bacterium]